MSDDFMTIRDKKIPIRSTRIEVSKLKFFAENPRIYSAIGADQYEPTQEEIQNKLIKMDHVKELVQDIKLNGDLIDAIIVKDGSYEVLEGNSRLAAYKELIKNDPIKWGMMRSIVLPADIDEASIFALLGQYHIKGKKDWLPFEQAGFLHRRHKRQGIEIVVLAKELGLEQSEARNLVATYELMTENKIKDPAKWSHFYEYVKSKKIKKHRRQFDSLDEIIIEKIKTGQAGKATDFRDGLKLLGDANTKVLKKFVDGDYSFEDAINAVEMSGNANEVFKRLTRFRTWFNKDETQEAIQEAKIEDKQKIEYECNKLYTIFKKHHDETKK